MKLNDEKPWLKKKVIWLMVVLVLIKCVNELRRSGCSSHDNDKVSMGPGFALNRVSPGLEFRSCRGKATFPEYSIWTSEYRNILNSIAANISIFQLVMKPTETNCPLVFEAFWHNSTLNTRRMLKLFSLPIARLHSGKWQPILLDRLELFHTEYERLPDLCDLS